MTVDPALREMLEAFGDDGGAPFDLHRSRAALDAFARAVGTPAPLRGAGTEQVAGVPVRRYRGEGPVRGPALVWVHGGGYVMGSLDAVDPLCRAVLARTGAAVTSLAYRLAPEYPFPAALDDVVRVLGELAQHGPVAVVGDSAGGGLAAAACRAARDAGLPVVGQLLLNPWLDLTMARPSVRTYGVGHGLTASALETFAALYLDGADPRDPRASPLLADDLAGLPPAVVVTAELDPLRDEGEAYAARLQEAGVPAVVRRYDGMVHGFPGMSALTPVADQALDWAVRELARLTG